MDCDCIRIFLEVARIGHAHESSAQGR